jgi:Zn-finger nucleic acid-binding protein
VLVAGLSGMHLHLFPEPERQDAHSATKCTKPSCGGETMLKKTISDLSEIVFDYCPKCEGIFLDKGEIQEVSQELEPWTEANLDKKTREYIDGHLVVEESVCIFYQPPEVRGGEQLLYFVRSSIYFEESLGLELNMFSEKWTDKLFRGIGLSRKQDIQVGDDQIDSRFIIQGTNEKEIISLLSDQNIQKTINLLEEKR